MKSEMEQAIQQEVRARFNLGHKAPIARTLLGEELKYLSNSEVAFEIISGTYSIPEYLDDATKLILTHIGRIGQEVLSGHFPPEIQITGDNYTWYHKRLQESTSSSPSGFHHGHGKAAAHSAALSETLAMQMNLTIQSGAHPTRWGTALQVLLEKVAGVCLVEKLRPIQLYEADLNWFMKFVFNDRAMKALTAADYLPEEHYSQKESTAEDACLDKTLTFDISRQSHTPMAIMSVDAAQCYDRVHHSIMSLVWLALTQHLPAVKILLSCLGDIKIDTRTGYGDSDTYFGGDTGNPSCGLGQGSRAAPASWVQLSSIFVKIFKEKGHGAKILDPITQTMLISIGCLYVDDTDLYEFESRLRSALEVYWAAQDTISLWSSLLVATGGAIKTEKSFWCMLDYVCKNGVWEYAPFQTYQLTVEQDGEKVTIPQRMVNDADKTLGVYHCPSGGHQVHMEKLRGKVDEWLNQMKNGHLPSALVWMSYRIQLWARIKYGLGTLTNSLEVSEQCLNEIDFQLLPLLNVNQHIRTGWRRIHQTFGGIGLLHLPTEQLICRLNMLQQHYETPTAVGRKLTCSLHWLQLQLGTNDNPLLLNYEIWSPLTCRSWWVELWHSLHVSAVNLSLKYHSTPFQCQGDKTIMQFLFEAGIAKADLPRLNRCRNYLNILFLSDITTADGCFISREMVSRHPLPLRSSFTFPREQPTKADWVVWSRAWTEATSTTLRLRLPLGKWTAPPHTKWVWHKHERSGFILEKRQGFTRLYKASEMYSHTRAGQRYEYIGQVEQELTGWPISITDASSQERPWVTVQSQSTSPLPLPSSDVSFWEKL